MEQTKIWVVQNSSGFSMGSWPHKDFLSQEDADFYCWLKNKPSGFPSMSYSYYHVTEVDVDKMEKGREYKKFVEEKIKEVEKSIKEREECSVKDSETIAKLNKQKEHYLSLK